MVCLNCQYQNCSLHNKKLQQSVPAGGEHHPYMTDTVSENTAVSATVLSEQQQLQCYPENPTLSQNNTSKTNNNNNNNNTSAYDNNMNINNSTSEADKPQQPFVRSTSSRKSSISLSSFRKSSNSVSFSDDSAPGPPKTSPTQRRILPNFNSTSSSFSSRTRKTSHVSFSDSGTGGKTSNSSSIHFPRVITGGSFSPSRRKSTNSVSISDSSESYNNNSSFRKFSCVSPGSPEVNTRGGHEANGTTSNGPIYRKVSGTKSLNETSSNGGHSPDSNTSSKNLKLTVPPYNRSMSSPCSSSPTYSPGKRSSPFSSSNIHEGHHHHHRVKKKSKWKRLLKGKKDKKVSPEAVTRWKSADNIYLSSGGSPRGSDHEGGDMGSCGESFPPGGTVGVPVNQRLTSSLSAYPLSNINELQQQQTSPPATGPGQQYTSPTPSHQPSPSPCTGSTICTSSSSSSSSISNISQPLGPSLQNSSIPKSTSTPLTGGDLMGKDVTNTGGGSGHTPTPLDLSNIPPVTHITMPTPTETAGENTFSGSPNGSPHNSPRVTRRQVSHETSDTDAQMQQYGIHHRNSRATDSQGNESGNMSREGSMERSYTDQSGYLASMEYQTSGDKMTSKGDKKNKKAWYNFSATYKSRSEDLKRLFKKLPGDERLIVDYSCALQKDILVHGRLYVTPNYFCFYSKIFGWETFMSIRCKDIVSMTKEKTALVIPNAIQINSDSEKNFFTSFASRDKTYLMLFRIWQNALMDQQMSSTELWQWVHSSYGSELGLTSDDDDYVAPSTEDDMTHTTKMGSSLSHMVSASHLNTAHHVEHPPRLPDHSLEDASNAEVSIDESLSAPHKTTSEQLQESHDQGTLKAHHGKESPFKNDHKHQAHLGASDGIQTAEALPTDMSDSTESDKENKAAIGSVSETVVCPVISSHHTGREVINEVFNLPVDAVFTLLFTNSTFMLDLYASRKTFDVVASPWQSNNETNQKLRQVTYTLTLPPNSFGPKVSHVTETQVLSTFSKPGEMYTVDAEACNAGIPYADSFFVGNHWCLTRESPTETRISVWTQVKYKKSVWGFMKGVIDKNSHAGVESMLADINVALVAETDRNNQKRTKRRRRVRGGSKADTVETVPPLLKDVMQKDHHHTKIPQAPPRKMTLPSIHVDTTSGISEGPVRVVVATLVILLTLNALLYYKLWDLEDKLHLHPAAGNTNPYATIDPNILRSSSGHMGPVEEWVRVLQQQENLHAAEVDRWRRSIEDAAGFLRKAEESLRGLHTSIPENQASKSQILLMQLRKLQELEKSYQKPTDELHCNTDPNKPPDDSGPININNMDKGDGQEL